MGSTRRKRSANAPALVQALRLSAAEFQRWPRPKPSTLPLGKLLASMEDDEVRAAALSLLDAFDQTWGQAHGFYWRDLIGRTLVPLGRRKLTWTPQEAHRAVVIATSSMRNWDAKSVAGFAASVLERTHGQVDPEAVERLVQRVADVLPPFEAAKLLARLRPFTEQLAGNVDARLVDDGDAWGLHIRELLHDLDPPDGINELLGHLAKVASKPSKRWLHVASQFLDAAPSGRGVLHAMVAEVLEVELQEGRHQYMPPVLLAGGNGDLVRGACFALAQADASSARLLGDVAVHAGSIRSGSGVPRDQKVANSAVAALGMIGSEDAVAGLVRCQQRIKNKTIRKQIDRSLLAAADAAGLGVDELIERAVPDHGLGEGGMLEERLGEDTVRLVVDGGKVRLVVAKARGGWSTTVPARLRERHPERIAELRAQAKEASKTLATERLRVEGLLAADRTWPMVEWRRLYRDHPLTGAWARQLLWIVGGPADPTVVRLDDGALVDVDDRAVTVSDDTAIELWHPMHVAADEVHQWRQRLDALELRQPFKQAWREVYLLTPAEEATEVYSNRFAAHILRYGQAFALMKTRDWGPSALGYWDGGYEGSASKVFPGGLWRASFFYDLIEHEPDGYESPSLCASDQVRFAEHVGGIWETVPLTVVPPLVFSEAMRDVDLFVGVASIAADPTWADRGEDRYLEYWHDTSFGELTESAETRREALERLLPRTKIADRASIEGRYLRVEGRLRTYKIHLGSGNILMEPNDQYLCIVAARDGRQRLFLPFEEDGGRLSLILSKAFLLVADDEIEDAAILAQLRQ